VASATAAQAAAHHPEGQALYEEALLRLLQLLLKLLRTTQEGRREKNNAMADPV
jgi:hypothetical protein